MEPYIVPNTQRNKSSRGVGSVRDVVDAEGQPIKVVQVQTETCRPCNEEHPKGEPCTTCGRMTLFD